MGRFRLNQTRLSQAVVAIAGCAASVGVGLEVGTGWGLVTGGVAGVAYGLVLVDVDEPEQGKR